RDIPLFGRLIGLADSFDAMSSNRTYRSGLSRHEVLSEIIRCRGSQFDPDLADLFVQLDFSAFDRAIAIHHRRDNPAAHATRSKEHAA
ncbi:MAG: HD-GYP domain-containing protein, partial [Phycisphaeraceae bacterium]